MAFGPALDLKREYSVSVQRQASTVPIVFREIIVYFLFFSKYSLLFSDINGSKATAWLLPLVQKRCRAVVCNFIFHRLIIGIFQNGCVLAA